MADIATIGFVAKTDDLKEAKTDLEALPPAAAKAETASKRLSDRIKELGGTMSSKLGASIATAKTALMGFAAGMIAAFSAQAIISGLSNIANKIDDISKAASKLRVNMGDLQGLGLAADLAGVSFDELATVANKMNKAIGQAIATGKENAGVFKLLGISAKELAALPIDQRFGRIADQMNAMNLSADQTALILTKLGDRNGSLAALFEGGSEAINQASEMLDRFNGKLTNDQGKQVEALNDSFTALSYAIEAVGTQLVATFGPYLTPLITGIAESIGFINRAISYLATSSNTFATGFRAAMGIVMNAFNPIGGALRALASLFQQVFGVSIGEAAKSGANFIINAFSGAFQATAIIWDRLPSVFGAAAYGAAKMALDGVNSFVQGAIAAFANLAASVASLFGVEVGKLDPSSVVDLTKTDLYQGIRDRATANAEDAKGAFTDASAAMSAQMQVDNFASAATKTQDATKSAVPAITDFGNALDTAGSKAGGATEKITELQRIAKELDTIGAPFEQAKSAFEKLRELQQNGIITGDQYTAMLGRIQNAFMAAGGTATQWGKIIGQQTIDMTAALKEFTTNALTSTGDAIADLAIEGKIDFKSLADSIIRDLIRVMWQALVVKPIISAVFPTLGFANGGVFGAGGLSAFADGGTFSNSVVTRPTLFQFADGGNTRMGVMGEAGDEAIMPLTRGSDGKLGVEAHGYNGGGGNVVNFGDVYIEQKSSGDPKQDAKHAQQTGAEVEAAMERVARRVVQQEAGYGGSLNPRGVKR